MPSGLFRREKNRWVFAGPTPASFETYDKDHSKLLVDYIFQLTAEEQRRVSAAMGRKQAATGNRAGTRKASSFSPTGKPSSVSQRTAAGGGSR
jgi:hypothetical protein